MQILLQNDINSYFKLRGMSFCNARDDFENATGLPDLAAGTTTLLIKYSLSPCGMTTTSIPPTFDFSFLIYNSFKGFLIVGVIMEANQRADVRSAAPGLSNGELCLFGTDQCVNVRGVRDVSGEGIGLTLDGIFPLGELVHLKLNTGEAELHLFGDVAWCEPALDELSDVPVTDLFMMGLFCR